MNGRTMGEQAVQKVEEAIDDPKKLGVWGIPLIVFQKAGWPGIFYLTFCVTAWWLAPHIASYVTANRELTEAISTELRMQGEDIGDIRNDIDTNRQLLQRTTEILDRLSRQ